MSNSEIRAFAWQRLWEGRWFWKLLAVAIFMNLCTRVMFSVLGEISASLGIDDWMTYLMTRAQNWQDQTTLVPNLTRDYIIRASGATAFEFFVGLILTGIASYAAAVALLKCLKNEQNSWFADSLMGFKMPFGLFGLAIARAFIGFVWVGILGMLPSAIILFSCQHYLSSFANSPTFLSGAVLTVLFMLIFAWITFCGLVPFYRYRFLYLIKVQHPDYSIGECLRASKEWMKGRTWESFKLDCSYWKLITLDLVILLVIFALAVFSFYAYVARMTSYESSLVINAFLPFFMFLILIVHIVISLVLVYYISVGQGKFYLNHE